MESKFSANTKSLLKSFISNKELFKRRKNSIILPLIFLLATIVSLCLPSYFISNNMKSDDITKNFPSVTEPMKEILTSSLNCTVKDATLVCDKNSYIEPKLIEGENGINYTIIVNQQSIALNTSVDEQKYNETDNLIIFFTKYIRIRYVARDYVNPIQVNEILGDYTNFEGLNLAELSNELLSNPEEADSKVNDFILKTYTSTLDTQLFVNLTSAFISFLLLVIVTCIMLEGQFLFKRKKGFKFSECLKISLTTTLPALIISALIYLVSGISFGTTFGLIYMARIVFIYFKYIFPRENIFKQIYQETGEERFNV